MTVTSEVNATGRIVIEGLSFGDLVALRELMLRGPNLIEELPKSSKSESGNTFSMSNLAVFRGIADQCDDLRDQLTAMARR